MPVIIWINGGFGAGKTTLAEELHRRLPDAVVYNPEDVGLMLWKWMPPSGDFQHLPSWRELVVATALSLRRHHADTLIVRMSLIRDAYRAEILGGLADAGEQVLHVFLEVDAGVLRERLNARVTDPKYTEWDQAARELGMTGVDEMVAAAARQPAGTLLLRSDRLTPAELADEVLASGRLAPGSRRRQADAAGKIAGLKRYLGCVAHQAEPIRRTSSDARQEQCPFALSRLMLCTSASLDTLPSPRRRRRLRVPGSVAAGWRCRRTPTPPGRWPVAGTALSRPSCGCPQRP